MEYKYFFERKKSAGVICYIVGIVPIIFILITFLTNHFEDESEIIESVIGGVCFFIFSFYIGRVLDSKDRNLKQWMSYLVTNGIKINGYVKEIRYISSGIYEFNVSYYSELENRELSFYTPRICIQNLNRDKKILCSVYEATEHIEVNDYTSEIINVDNDNHKIYMSANPFKLFSTTIKQESKDWFGDAVATDFHYEEEAF